MSRASFLTRLPASLASAVIAVALLAAGCSSAPKKEAVVFPAGEKVTVGPLVYSVIDSQVLTQLGDDRRHGKNSPEPLLRHDHQCVERQQ